MPSLCRNLMKIDFLPSIISLIKSHKGAHTDVLKEYSMELFIYQSSKFSQLLAGSFLAVLLVIILSFPGIFAGLHNKEEFLIMCEFLLD